MARRAFRKKKVVPMIRSISSITAPAIKGDGQHENDGGGELHPDDDRQAEPGETRARMFIAV